MQDVWRFGWDVWRFRKDVWRFGWDVWRFRKDVWRFPNALPCHWEGNFPSALYDPIGVVCNPSALHVINLYVSGGGLKKCAFFVCFRPTQKIARGGPKWGREVFFRLIQTLPTFWVTWILITFDFEICLDSNFWISRFPDFQNLVRVGLGPGRPGLETSGPTYVDFLL